MGPTFLPFFCMREVLVVFKMDDAIAVISAVEQSSHFLPASDEESSYFMASERVLTQIDISQPNIPEARFKYVDLDLPACKSLWSIEQVVADFIRCRTFLNHKGKGLHSTPCDNHSNKSLGNTPLVFWKDILLVMACAFDIIRLMGSAY